MAANVQHDGHDAAGTLSSNQTVLSADAGHTFYDTTLQQLYVCTGSGVFVPVGVAGNVAAGAAGAVKSVTKRILPVDATFTDVATITVPNAIHGAGIRVTAVGILGDGDSASCTQFHGAISRIAGAATGVTFGAAITAGTNNGVTANASVAIQASAIAGAVGAQQTFTVQMRVSRSAGTSGPHVLVATVEVLNGFAAGITIA